MPTSRYARGAVVKCLFPYDTDPARPGPSPHYCLLIDEYEFAGKAYAAVCYGTSRLDESLIRAHAGMILSVPSEYIKGPMPGKVTHFIADHVAMIALDDRWFYPGFNARLDYIREKDRKGDFKRLRLYEAFQPFAAAMDNAAVEAVENMLQTGRIGLPAGKTLR